jgi:hypothetical protein
MSPTLCVGIKSNFSFSARAARASPGSRLVCGDERGVLSLGRHGRRLAAAPEQSARSEAV